MRIFWVILAITYTLYSHPARAELEEPEYSIISAENQIEIREYDTNVMISTRVRGSFKEASNDAFMLLAKYINGHNETGSKIAMTAPVIQKKENKFWKVSFFLPQKYSKVTAPLPKDARIEIEELPKRKMAAITFSGSWRHENFQKHATLLTEYLTNANIAYNDTQIIARYNHPFVLWFLRRNEVMYHLK